MNKKILIIILLSIFSNQGWSQIPVGIRIYPEGEPKGPYEFLIQVSAGGSLIQSTNLEEVQIEILKKAKKFGGNGIKNLQCWTHRGYANVFYECQADVIKAAPTNSEKNR